MTAKEYLTKQGMSLSVIYHFKVETLLKDFTKLKCKEQKEIIAKGIQDNIEYLKTDIIIDIDEDIKNALTPEL